MRFHDSLDRILGTETRVKILRAFFRLGWGAEFTGRHIARLCNLPQKSVQKNLLVLREECILAIRYAGKSHLFSMNKSHPLFDAMKSIFESEGGLYRTLCNLVSEQIKRNPVLKMNVVSASIYGSVSKGTERPDSDVDVFIIVGNKDVVNKVEDELTKVGKTVRDAFGNSLHFLVKPRDSLGELRREKKAIHGELLKTSTNVYGKKVNELMEPHG